jgi:hypothetical protein
MKIDRRGFCTAALSTPLLSLLPTGVVEAIPMNGGDTGQTTQTGPLGEINIKLRYLHQGRTDIFSRFMEVLKSEDEYAFRLLKEELRIPIINGPMNVEMLCLTNFYDGLDIHIPYEAKRLSVFKNSQGYWVEYKFDGGVAILRQLA